MTSDDPLIGATDMTADEKTLGEQMTTWQIGESGTELVLDGDGEGEVTFTVTNTSEAQDRAVLTITPLDGAADSWFTVDEPQRAVAAGASVVYPVKVKVPSDTAAGTFGMQGVAYSADTDPGESSVTSKRVGITVPPPPPKKGIPKWIFIVIAAVVLLVFALAAFFLTRSDGGGLTNEEPPVITGTPAVLETLQASQGNWSEEVDVKIEWQRCDRDGDGCEIIEGAGGPVLIPGVEDVNLTLRAQVTATSKEDEEDTAVATSELTAPVDGANLGNAPVPPVTNLPSSQAAAILRADFTVRVERSTSSTLAPSCDPIVVDQTPDAGIVLPRGSEVTIETGPRTSIRACLPQLEVELSEGLILIDDPPVTIPEELFRRAAEASP
jgi:hypothetical protein